MYCHFEMEMTILIIKMSQDSETFSFGTGVEQLNKKCYGETNPKKISVCTKLANMMHIAIRKTLNPNNAELPTIDPNILTEINDMPIYNSDKLIDELYNQETAVPTFGESVRAWFKNDRTPKHSLHDTEIERETNKLDYKYVYYSMVGWDSRRINELFRRYFEANYLGFSEVEKKCNDKDISRDYHCRNIKNMFSKIINRTLYPERDPVRNSVGFGPANPEDPAEFEDTSKDVNYHINQLFEYNAEYPQMRFLHDKSNRYLSKLLAELQNYKMHSTVSSPKSQPVVETSKSED